MDPPASSLIVYFGVYEADLRNKELRKQGIRIKLQEQPFQVLAVLLEHPGEVVTRDMLRQRVWPADTFIEFDQSLNKAVNKIREALGDTAENPRFVATVPRHGYRFIAPVDLAEHALSVAVRHEQPAIPPAASRVSRPWYVPLASALAVFGLAAGIFLNWRRPRPSIPPPRPLTQLTFDAGLQTDPTWSPDGRMIAYASNRQGSFHIFVQHVGSTSSLRVTNGAAHDWQPDWSPDGRLIVFRSERDGGGLYVVPALGGAERRISSFGYRPRWSSDGSLILFQDVFPRETHVLLRGQYVVGLDGSPPRRVLAAQIASMLDDVDATDWFPGSQRISVWGQVRGSRHGLVTFSLAGGTAVRSALGKSVEEELRASPVDFRQFRWSPTGRALYLEGISKGVRSLWKVDTDPATLRWISGPERLTTGPGEDSGAAVSRDGRKLAFGARTENTRAWVFPFDAESGKVQTHGVPVTPPGVNTFFLDLSPDGSKLAFTSEGAGKKTLWLKSLDDGRATLLDEDCDCHPIWSRDGRRLTYVRVYPNDTAKTFAVPASGGDAQLLEDWAHTNRYEARGWSEDGTHLLGGRWLDNPVRYQICLWPLPLPQGDTGVRVLASRPDLAPYESRFSPGDRWIVFEVVYPKAPGVTTIQVMPGEGGPWLPITEGRFWDDKPRWAPDGRTIYFISNRTGLFNLWGRRFDPVRGRPLGAPFQVTGFDSPSRIICDRTSEANIALSRHRLVLPVTEISGNLWMLENIEK